MHLQGKSKFDTWLLNSDWTKSHKYFLVLFVVMAFYSIYESYTEYQASEFSQAIFSSANAGMFFMSALYYIVIMLYMSRQARLNKENTELLFENFELKQEILILKMPNLKKQSDVVD